MNAAKTQESGCGTDDKNGKLCLKTGVSNLKCKQ